MVNVREDVIVYAHVIQVGDALGFAANGTGFHLVLVAEDDDKSRSVLRILALDETADGRGGVADLVGIVHVHIEAFGGLPCNPFLHRLLKYAVGDDEHLHRGLPQVGVLVIHIVAPVEHLLVNGGKIGAEGAGELVVGSGLVVVIVVDFQLDVVINHDATFGRIVSHRIHGQRADLDATHCAENLEIHKVTGAIVLAGVGLFVIGELDVLGLLVLPDRRLLRHESVDVEIAQLIFRCRVADDFRGDVLGTVWNGYQLVHNGK